MIGKCFSRTGGCFADRPTRFLVVGGTTSEDDVESPAAEGRRRTGTGDVDVRFPGRKRKDDDDDEATDERFSPQASSAVTDRRTLRRGHRVAAQTPPTEADDRPGRDETNPVEPRRRFLFDGCDGGGKSVRWRQLKKTSESAVGDVVARRHRRRKCRSPVRTDQSPV